MRVEQKADSACDHGWELTVLDSWELIHGGKPQQVHIGGQRLIAALAVLGPQTQDRLAGVLWPDCSGAGAAANLRACLVQVTDQLPGMLVVSHDSLFLDPRTRTDYQQVRWLMADIGNGAAPPNATIILGRAHLLPGWYDDWALIAQEQLQLQCMKALESLAHHFLDAGNPARAIEAAQLAAAIEPLSENAQLILLRAYQREGNTAAATHIFNEFRNRLRTEVGLSPSARFTELLETPGEPPEPA